MKELVKLTRQINLTELHTLWGAVRVAFDDAISADRFVEQMTKDALKAAATDEPGPSGSDILDAEEAAEAAWQHACGLMSEARTVSGAAEEALRACTEKILGNKLTVEDYLTKTGLVNPGNVDDESILEAEIALLRQAVIDCIFIGDDDAAVRYHEVVNNCLTNFGEGADVVIFGEEVA